MYDLILRNGHVLDGTGSPWYKVDVAIVGERIAAMARDIGGSATREIDARNLVVSPGFIDTHAHSDATLLVNPRAESAVRQGITSQLVGHCGFSAAPVRAEDLEAFRQDSFVFSYEGYEWTWTDIAGYRDALANAQPAINVATLVGHGALRQYAMGQADRLPSSDELETMKVQLREALEQGARGFSTGLTYAPGRFSESDELVELGKVAGQHDGIYHTHMRDQGRFLLDSIREAIRVAEEAGIPGNVSHMYPCPRPFWGELAFKATTLFESARQRGVEITFDVTPWTRGGGPYMQSLPSWAQEGGFAALKTRLEDTATRQEIARQLDEGAPGWKEWLPKDWEDFLIARTGRREHDGWAGRTVAEIAEERGLPPAEASLMLLLEDDGQYWIAPTIKSQDDLNHILNHPLGIPITDGMALAPYGPLHHPTMPRSYGTFPRVLGRYARDWGVISMEEAVQKLTSMAALRAGIVDRGVLRPGLYADVTVFDPQTVLDRETYQDPHAFPAGIEYVVVNGQVVVDQGGQHDIRPGKVL